MYTDVLKIRYNLTPTNRLFILKNWANKITYYEFMGVGYKNCAITSQKNRLLFIYRNIQYLSIKMSTHENWTQFRVS